MGSIAARRVVTSVQHMRTFRDGAMCQFPCKAMRQQGEVTLLLSPDAEQAVAIRMPESGPLVAGILTTRGIYLRNKPSGASRQQAALAAVRITELDPPSFRLSLSHWLPTCFALRPRALCGFTSARLRAHAVAFLRRRDAESNTAVFALLGNGHDSVMSSERKSITPRKAG
jgi:hypothetical protein